MSKLIVQPWVESLASSEPAQKIAFGVDGNAVGSIAGLACDVSTMLSSSWIDGIRQPPPDVPRPLQ